ncbi:hypothetical protein OIU84_010205 [Salix udensis]|uniref:PTM/DIR17-like Tudor domain-containing protein n=1 Tax=Salix udensis TaxID=889485 RepID=A0AAD6NV84_9ROSI|nr:hypothetical protein OIU84_010205 [Salix udensis]
MDNTSKEVELESLPTGVFELPGEPAIVINGVPDISPSDGSPVLPSTCGGITSQSAEFFRNSSFGEWLEGREVQKLFGENYFSGTVSLFDKETGWYRVVYEDGDSEELDWKELQEVLLPLDITVPLKSLAQKIIKKSQKTVVHKSVKSGTRPRITKAAISGSLEKDNLTDT